MRVQTRRPWRPHLDRKDGAGDNSNTQFAVLGLWVASRFGVPIDEGMREVGSRFVNTQNEDGGWGYTIKDKEPTPSTQAMTPAGLFCLTVARATKIRAQLKDRSATSSSGERVNHQNGFEMWHRAILIEDLTLIRKSEDGAHRVKEVTEQQ